jgi:Arm DNA-binding domain
VPRIRLSDIGLRSLPTPQSGTIDYWDATLPNFGLRISRGGAKTFILKLNNSRRAIGRFPLISLSEARTEAKRLLAEKTLGKVRPQSITFPQAVEVFLEEKAKARRPSTVADLKDRLKRHFPFKGQLADVGHQEFVRALSKIKTPSEHNHALRVGKTFFTWAVNRRYISENPAIWNIDTLYTITLSRPVRH